MRYVAAVAAGGRHAAPPTLIGFLGLDRDAFPLRDAAQARAPRTSPARARKGPEPPPERWVGKGG